jgi:predicted ATPase
MTGHIVEGQRVLAEALATAHHTEERYYKAELYRLNGTLLLRQAVPDEKQAATCFQQALAVARHQQARSWELRAATSLSRLWQRQGKRQEARDLLAPVYDWFTEGFDTADLREAKGLLEELS